VDKLSKLKKVLVIASYGDSLINFRGELLKDLCSKSCQVIACAPNLSHKVIKFLKSLSIEDYDLPLDRTGFNPIKDLRTIAHIMRLIVIKKPDMILAYTVKPNIFTGIALSILRRCTKTGKKTKFFPLITGIGSIFLQERNTNLLKNALYKCIILFYRASLSNAKKVIFQNKDDQKLFLKLGIVDSRKRCEHVAGSGVNLKWFRPHLLPQKQRFLMVARLLGHKGVREYAQAAEIVRKKIPGTVFQLAGGWDENPSSISKNELVRWKTNKTIVYLGELRDVRPALKKCRYFVLPSYREGLPRSVLEAMATGRPILTTDVPGCRDTVHSGKNGYKVFPQSSEALADKMIMLVKHSEKKIKKMAQTSLALARKKYDVRLVNAQLVKIFRG